MALKKIGLIGGMSFEGTAVYYRKINEAVNQALGELNSAEILLESVNFQDIVALQKTDQWPQAGERLAQAARHLQAGGAECVLMAAVTMIEARTYLRIEMTPALQARRRLAAALSAIADGRNG